MTGNIVVITGGSAGIGRAAALEFARHGWRVAVLARGEEALSATCQEIRAVGADALAIPIDVADAAQVEAAAEQVEREWGPIGAWVNNAMATVFCPAEQLRADDVARVTDVTYLGAVWGTLAALRRMKPRNHGTIVQVGSALAYRSIPLQAAYCGAKSAIRAFIDAVRCELIHDRSRVHLTMVELSAFNTPQFDWSRNCFNKRAQPLGKIFQPEVAARGIYWAATHRRRALWVGWPAAQAMLGQRLLPALLDHRLAFSAYEGQLANTDDQPGRADNLYHPVPGDHGAHGRFDSQARPRSVTLWCATHRRTLAAGAALLGITAALVRRLGR